MRKKQTIGSIMLLMTSIIWGCAFVAQKVGMDYIGPFSFCGFRFLFSASFLIMITICRDFIFYKKLSLFQMEKQKRKKVFLGGILCGVSLAIASVLQQYSMQGTTAGKAGFITALYIVLVPILGMFIKKKVKIVEWISVIIALISLILLCFQKGEVGGIFSIHSYDWGLLVCAVFFSIQILFIDYFAKDNDCLMMSTIQFIVCAIISCLLMIIFEKPQINQVKHAMIPLLYAGIASGGIAYTLQFIGQKYTRPIVASIIMSLESVVSLLAGMILINESLTSREMWGCALMFMAMIISQLPLHKFNKKSKNEV